MSLRLAVEDTVAVAEAVVVAEDALRLPVITARLVEDTAAVAAEEAEEEAMAALAVATVLAAVPSTAAPTAQEEVEAAAMAGGRRLVLCV